MITSTPLQQQLPRFSGLACSLILFGSSSLWAATAPTAPAQKPMLTASTGAKPNLMITLDNSGSMARPYQESYAVKDTTQAKMTNQTKCNGANGYYGADGVKGGLPRKDNNNKYYCYTATQTTTNDKCVSSGDYDGLKSNKNISNLNILSYWKKNNSSCTKNPGTKDSYRSVRVSYVANTFTEQAAGLGVISGLAWDRTTSPWHAARSSEVNWLFYDPRTTYSPRVDASGTPIALESPVIKFVSNQDTVSTTTYKLDNYTNKKKYFNWMDNGVTSPDNAAYTLSENWAYPKLKPYTSPDNNTPDFTWVICNRATASNCEVKDMVVVDIKYGQTTPVELPADHKRTDCGANAAIDRKCPAAAEIENIINWYRYYTYRAQAVATAVGITLSKSDYRNKLRVGYYNINNEGSTNSSTIGFSSADDDKYRGVRVSSIDNNQQLLNWLYGYGSIPDGGTPLHNSVDKVAAYYRSSKTETVCTKTDWWGNCTASTTSTTNATENPWAADPSKQASASNIELTCRRSFNLLFSDGAWNSATNTGENTDYTDQTDFISSTGLPGFAGYKKDGYNSTVIGRKMYTPFGNNQTGGLSDLTAKYFWAQDLRPELANEIVARAGQPTTWQNMATYTVGYMMRPSGEITGATSGLTFDDIENYKISYLKDGASATKPAWAVDTSGSKNLIDDFVQAGYTGGGSSYSVTTPEDVQRAFDLILSDILNASGKDAGVAVAGTSSTTSTLEGRLKYSVGYKTVDNSGNLEAIRLSASGNNAGTVWDSNEKWPAAKDRKLFVYDKVTNKRKTVDFDTTLGSLPGALHKAIDPTGALPTGTEFIRYLLGDDTALANSRTRTPGLASSVNAPPLYVGSRLNMGYGRDTSTVPGKKDYVTYFSNKIDIPGTIYAATNDGQVHVFNAADTDANEEVKDSTNKTIPPGTEVASFLLRTTMPKLQSYASPAYSFEYMADGPLVEQDVWDGSAWKQMVFGTTGRGGKGVFAFNSPLNMGANKNRIPTEEDYKWEATDSDLANIGYVSNPVAAGFTEDGKSVLLVSGGHYANTGKAGLYVLDALTGDEIAFIELPNGYDFGVGLGGVTVVRNAARQIVAAYAGDANGNLWRFNLRGNSTAWGVSNNQPLFTTPGNQPIYAAPAWQVHPGANGDACQSSASPGACGTIVVIGTGILLDDTHLSDTSTQSIYGIWDNTPIGGNDEAYKSKDSSYSLVTQTIDQVNSKAGVGSSLGNTFYQVSKNDVDWKKNYGWRLDLGKLTNTAGERVIGDPFNLGSSVFVTSVVISDTQTTEDSCIAASGAVNVMYGIDALTGGGKRSFDQDGDGKLDPFSVVYLPKGGFTRSSVLTQNSNVSDILDPNLKIGVGDPKEGDIDLLPLSKATGRKGYSTGIDGSILLGDGTESSGWRRSWRQIINLPDTL